MNKIYRLVWSSALRDWVAAQENAVGRSQGSRPANALLPRKETKRALRGTPFRLTPVTLIAGMLLVGTGLAPLPCRAQTVDVPAGSSLTAATGTNTPADGAVWNLTGPGVYLTTSVGLPNGTLTINGNGNTLTQGSGASPSHWGAHQWAPGYFSIPSSTSGGPSTLNLSDITLTGLVNRTNDYVYGSVIGSTPFDGIITVNANHVTFSNNSSVGTGPSAVYGTLFGDRGIVINGNDLAFLNNNATNSGTSVSRANGGAIAANSGNLSITGNNIVFAGNSVTANPSLSNPSNASGNGGAIYGGNTNLTITGGNITFSGNSAYTYGGAIYSNAPITITATSGDITFSGNSATLLGGAIYSSSINNTGVVLNATGGNIVFSGNTQQGNAANAIYFSAPNNGVRAIFNTGAGNSITFFDPLGGWLPSTTPPRTVLYVTGSGTVAFDGSQYTNAADRTSGILVTTLVQGGTFRVDNGAVYGLTGSTMAVSSGATLSGNGTVVADTTVANGGIFAPGGPTSPGTLTINGNLGLGSSSILNYRFGEANVPGGPFNDLAQVNGNLTLDGTINVLATPGGSFDPGVYRVFDYTGTLTDNGLSLGTMPPGSAETVQTSVANQVNLVVPVGAQPLTFWDGDAGPKNNGVVNGGDGTWQNSPGNDNWTLSTGSVNAPWTDSAFAIFQGVPGTVIVDNSLGQVRAGGMQFAVDGYRIDGEPLTLTETEAGTGQSIIRVGDGATDGADYTAKIDSVLQGTTQLVKSDLGTLVLGGANTYTGGTAVSGGTLRIGSDDNLGDTAGSVTLDGGTLETTQDITTNRAFAITGNNGTIQTDAGTAYAIDSVIADATTGTPGGLTKTGAGLLALAGANTYSGETTVGAGTLQARAPNVFSPDSSVRVASPGKLDLDGFSQSVAGLSNGGLVSMGSNTAPGTVLTVNGNYVGTGGTIAFNTELGDDTSATDRMVVNGSTSGSTSVQVTHAGGDGAYTIGNGIELIQVNGVSPANAFALGRPVEAGAYQYLLYQGGVGANATDGNWYLRSQLEPPPPGEPGPEPDVPAPPPVAWRPGVAAYTLTPLLNLDYGFSVLGTLHQRVGDVPGAIDPRQNAAANGVWGRADARSFDADAGRFSTDSTTYFAQFGKDWTLDQSGDGGSTHAGATVTFGDTSATFYDPMRFIAGLDTQTGSVSTQAGSLGGYWTRYLKDGTYFDSVGQVTYYHNRYSGQDGRATQNGVGMALSQEVGKPFRIGSTPIAIEPQAQLMYQYLSLGGFSDAISAVSGMHTNALRGRAGFRIYAANPPDRDHHDPLSSARPYLTFNVLHDFLRPGQTVVGETPFNPTFSRTWFDVGAGVTAAVGKHGELYAHGGYQHNLGGGNGQGWYGQLAWRYLW